MNPLTPAQQKQMQTWAEQRDSLLGEIALYTTTRDDRKKEADGEALRLTDLHTQEAEVRGRISVLLELEERVKNSTHIEVAELTTRKSRLESENSEQESVLNASKREHGVVIAATAALSAANGVAKDQAQIITTVLSQLKTTSVDHLSEAKELVHNMKAVHDTVIDRANENLNQSKVVLEKMPKFIFDMQKPIPVRRTYPAGHPRIAMEAAETSS